MCKRLKINAGILHITKHHKDAQIKLRLYSIFIKLMLHRKDHAYQSTRCNDDIQTTKEILFYKLPTLLDVALVFDLAKSTKSLNNLSSALTCLLGTDDCCKYGELI